MRKLLLVVALVSTALALVSVLLLAVPFESSPPSSLLAVAEQVASPGEFLWWSTVGGAFSGRPASTAGLAVWVLGTASFWFLVLTALALPVRACLRRKAAGSG